jgi:matrix metalloproteinase-14 (membrane-inserted)
LYGANKGRRNPEANTQRPPKPTTTSAHHTPAFIPLVPILPEKPKDNSDICVNSTLDAIVTAADGGTYVFKGDYYWSLIPNHDLPFNILGSRRISDDWKGLDGTVDAAFTHVSRHFGRPSLATFIFKGDQCWRFTIAGLSNGYPRPISKVFTGIPNDLDAALFHEPTGNIYFFKGEQYWRFEPYKNAPVDETQFPRDISEHWGGLASPIQAAFPSPNGLSAYFFKDSQYHEYDFAHNNVRHLLTFEIH